MPQDLANRISAAPSIQPAAHTADVDGASVDLQGFESAAVIVLTGDYTDGEHTFEVQEADDDGTGSPGAFSAVADADLEGTEPVVDAAGDADSVFEIGYQGTKRHIRVSLTQTGVTSGAEMAAFVVRGHARHQPV